VLTLLWTLLRQGPDGVPVVRKAIVVAPATLVKNWANEVCCRAWVNARVLASALARTPQ
jgi:SNF2 family DNA or RNA helicase